jgi:hypothetical protein
MLTSRTSSARTFLAAFLSLLALLAVFVVAAASRAQTIYIGEEKLQGAADYEALVTLPFVTNRAVETRGDGRRYFGNKLGTFTSGRCSVAVRGGGEAGDILAVEETAPEDTLGAVNASADPSVIVYFHGYYEDFERSCQRAARFKYRLGLDSELLLFTWPANSTPLTYGADVADLEASVPTFLLALEELGERFGPGNISIVAHSLGSRGMVKSLREWPERPEKFRDLILVAADIDRELFVESLPLLRAHTENITLLVSARDRALDVSKVVNRAPRLGQATDLAAQGVAVIDVTDIADTHFSGHIYHLRNPAVVDLIRSVLKRSAN